ncbi:MAG: N-acetyltransferase [Myxococcales bacterium]|nr:N-acetyltransferase [Myxococcales bacterium]
MARHPSVFVHEKALCESDEVGEGTRVWAFAHVMKGARLGAHCNVGDHAFIESGAVIGDRVTVKNCVLVWDKVTVEDEVFLGPNMVFTNDMNPRVAFKKAPEQFLPTKVKRGASIGANATIVCGVTIGEQAFVGAGSVVIRDVPAHALVVGNPARRIGWMCECGGKLPASLKCRCGRAFRLASEREGLVPL